MRERKIYLIVCEEVEGPFTMEEIRRQIAGGRLTSDLLCAENGSTVWKPVAELLAEHEDILRT